MLKTLIGGLKIDLITFHAHNRHLNPLFCQTVRWRKPRWVPKARSKIFRVSERKVIPLEEKEELQRLYNNYRTEIKSIRAFLAEHLEQSQGTDQFSTSIENEEEENIRCSQLNDKWNEEVRLLREQILDKEKEEEFEEILKNVEDHKIKMEENRQKVEEIVRMEKERAKSYITAENIDEAIEKSLENAVDFNFAIDIKGNFYYGKKAKPPKITSLDAEEPTPSVAVNS